MKTNIKYFYILLILFWSHIVLYAETNSNPLELNVIVIDENGCPIEINQDLFQEGPFQESRERDDDNDTISWNAWFWQQLMFDEDFYNSIDQISEETFGGIFLRMCGYYDQPPEIGCFGNGEVSDNVRITMVNGILCIQEDVLNAAKLISDTHGNTNVHYVFRPTQGWAWDLIKSTLVKCGYMSQQAYDIVLTWRALIAEMELAGKGGKIIHYAHSIGAADTFAAKSLLLPEELEMISVVTFGSPILFPNVGFQSVVNYASVRDSVPILRKLGIAFDEQSNLVWVGSHFGFPFIDHLLDNGTYRSVLEGLGQEFVNQYGMSNE